MRRMRRHLAALRDIRRTPGDPSDENPEPLRVRADDGQRVVHERAMSREAAPLEVGPTEDGEQLRIRWRDGAVSEYPPRYLRLMCPCAGCVEEMTGRPLLNPASVPMDVHPLAIRYVGDYAIRFDWSDGHGTGIYPFDYLRDISPST